MTFADQLITGVHDIFTQWSSVDAKSPYLSVLNEYYLQH